MSFLPLALSLSLSMYLLCWVEVRKWIYGLDVMNERIVKYALR